MFMFMYGFTGLYGIRETEIDPIDETADTDQRQSCTASRHAVESCSMYGHIWEALRSLSCESVPGALAVNLAPPRVGPLPGQITVKSPAPWAFCERPLRMPKRGHVSEAVSAAAALPPAYDFKALTLTSV